MWCARLAEKVSHLKRRTLFVRCHRATVMDYLQAHEEKMLEKMGLDVNHKSMVNPWSGRDLHATVNHMDGSTGSQPAAPLMKMKSGAAAAVTMTTTSQRGGGGQILIYLLRLRQCCSHLSILRDVSVFPHNHTPSRPVVGRH